MTLADLGVTSLLGDINSHYAVLVLFRVCQEEVRGGVMGDGVPHFPLSHSSLPHPLPLPPSSLIFLLLLFPFVLLFLHS